MSELTFMPKSFMDGTLILKTVLSVRVILSANKKAVEVGTFMFRIKMQSKII